MGGQQKEILIRPVGCISLGGCLPGVWLFVLLPVEMQAPYQDRRRISFSWSPVPSLTTTVVGLDSFKELNPGPYKTAHKEKDLVNFKIQTPDGRVYIGPVEDHTDWYELYKITDGRTASTIVNTTEGPLDVKGAKICRELHAWYSDQGFTVAGGSQYLDAEGKTLLVTEVNARFTHGSIWDDLCYAGLVYEWVQRVHSPQSLARKEMRKAQLDGADMWTKFHILRSELDVDMGLG